MQTNVKDKRQGLAVMYGHGLLRRLLLLHVILSLSCSIDANTSLLWDTRFSQLDIPDIPDIPDITLTFRNL
jgi:hypothetical protein